MCFVGVKSYDFIFSQFESFLWALAAYLVFYLDIYPTPWRNGSASDSRSEGCVFKSRRGQLFFLLIHISDSWEVEWFFYFLPWCHRFEPLVVSKQKIIVDYNVKYAVDPEKLSTETKQINAWFTSLRGVCVKKSFFYSFGSSFFLMANEGHFNL